ncbi:hypothetical protein [Streptomyces sp. AM6-12]|uniref:hypothetical protein n=1 Tax=Streptomyces sp. AM6-12 TaxID=3345149 RepID=UPI00379FFF82
MNEAPLAYPYAVQGVGYTITASASAAVLSGSTSVAAIVGGVAITVDSRTAPLSWRRWSYLDHLRIG